MRMHLCATAEVSVGSMFPPKTNMKTIVFLTGIAPFLFFGAKGLRGLFTKFDGKSFWLSVASLLGLAAFVTAYFIVPNMYAESRWWDSLGFGAVYWKRITWQIGAFAFGALSWGCMAWLLGWPAARILQQRDFKDREPNPWDIERKHKTDATKSERVRHTYGFLRFVFILALSVFGGFELADQWNELLLAASSVTTGIADPIFNRDISFYLFHYDAWNILIASLLKSGFGALIAWPVCCSLALMDRRTSDPEDELWCLSKLIPTAFWQMGLWVSVLAAYLVLHRFAYLWEDSKLFTGIDRTTHAALLPGRMIFCTVLFLTGLFIAFCRNNMTLKRWVCSGGAVGLTALVFLGIWPAIYWHSNVKNSQSSVEGPYIQHALDNTRAAYGLDKAEDAPYDPKKLSMADVRKARATIENLPLWDYRALAETLNQKQRLKAFYDLHDVDVGRMTIDGRVRQVMLSSREINVEGIDPRARNWENVHLVYTHGNGVCLNLASEFGENGSPVLRIKDLPAVSDIPGVKITRPEIYFGEMTHHHVYVGSNREEYSHPEGDTNRFTHYTGSGGVRIGSGFGRFLFALEFDGYRTLASKWLTADTRLMWRREITQRVRTLAPFLRFDNDAYKVIRADGSLVYIIDAFTTSDKYPYSHSYTTGANYIRNSVKAVVNAYDGKVTFYVFEPGDPVIRTWMNAFPALFTPREQMPADLVRHIRYSEDLLDIQAHALSEYHMTQPEDFFSRDDRWEIPSETYDTGKQPIEPYSAVIKLPGEEKEEFLLMLPLSVKGRNNLGAWIAGRSDGSHYGKLKVYRLPTSREVDGPQMVGTSISQHKDMAPSFRLWDSGGAHPIRGHMLVVPVEGGLLYAEPIYIRSREAAMPQLAMIVIGTDSRVVWGDTQDEAIKNLFGAEPTIRQGIAQLEAAGLTSESKLKEVRRLLGEYSKLTGEQKFGAAAQMLEQIKQLVDVPNTNQASLR